MAWSIEFSDEADRDFAKLDKAIQRRIFRYLHERIANAENSRDLASGYSMNSSDCGVIASETIAYSAPSKKKSELYLWLR